MSQSSNLFVGQILQIQINLDFAWTKCGFHILLNLNVIQKVVVQCFAKVEKLFDINARPFENEIHIGTSCVDSASKFGNTQAAIIENSLYHLSDMKFVLRVHLALSFEWRHKKSVELISCLCSRVSTPHLSYKLFHAVAKRHLVTYS